MSEYARKPRALYTEKRESYTIELDWCEIVLLAIVAICGIALPVLLTIGAIFANH